MPASCPTNSTSGALQLWSEVPSGISTGADLVRSLRDRRRVDLDVTPHYATTIDRRPASQLQKSRKAVQQMPDIKRRAMRGRSWEISLARTSMKTALLNTVKGGGQKESPLAMWPAQASGGLTGSRPQLLQELEQYMNEEMRVATTEDAKLRVTHDVFRRFIDAFPVYSSLLKRVQEAYEDQMVQFSRLRVHAEEMHVHCANASIRETEEHVRLSRESDIQIANLDDRLKSLQRHYEKSRFDLEAEKKARLEEKVKSAQFQSLSEQLAHDKRRMSEILGHLNTAHDELKQLLAAKTEECTHLQADLEATISGLMHDNEMLNVELEELKHRYQHQKDKMSGRRKGDGKKVSSTAMKVADDFSGL